VFYADVGIPVYQSSCNEEIIMKISSITILSLAAALLPVAGFAQSIAKPSAFVGPVINGSVSTSDRRFVRGAAQGGMAEVELGKLAAEKGSTDEVKKFGQRMVDDHSKAGDQLKQIASEKGITVPQQLSAKDRALKDRLSKLSGEDFDKAYMSDMVKDHTQDVADFQRESNAGTDSDIKDFAAKTLPTLQDHLRQAKEIAPSARAANSGGQ
jgi:putative membrane protein